MIATDAEAVWLHIWLFPLFAQSSDMRLALHWELFRHVLLNLPAIFAPSLGLLRLVHLHQRLQ